MILNKKITRKQFIATVVTFAGFSLASRLPLGLGDFSKKKQIDAGRSQNSYGNQPYGGTKSM